MPIVFSTNPATAKKRSNSLLLSGVLLLLFGTIIIVKPEILAYMIAWMCIVGGIILLSIWIQLR